MSRHFLKKDIQMALMHMIKCSMFLFIRKCKVKLQENTSSHPLEWLKLKWLTDWVWRGRGATGIHRRCWGSTQWYHHSGKLLSSFYQRQLCVCPMIQQFHSTEICTYVHQRARTRIFIAALILRADPRAHPNAHWPEKRAIKCLFTQWDDIQQWKQPICNYTQGWGVSHTRKFWTKKLDAEACSLCGAVYLKYRNKPD